MRSVKILKNKSIIIFLVLAVVITIYLDSVACLIKRVFPLSSISGIVTLSDRVLFLTFLALVWYAWETRGMKKQIIEQNKLSICPILVIYPKDETLGKGYKEFKIRNIGKGIALKIQFSKYKVSKGIEEIPGIKESSILKPGEEKDIVIKEKMLEGKSLAMDDKVEPFFLLNDNVKDVIINFEDIRGNKYESKISLKDQGLTYFEELK